MEELKEPYWKKRRRRRPDKVRAISRKHYLKSKYNISLEDYDDLLDSQCYCCAICDTCLAYVKNVCVDHDHKTGKVRGILCGRCNKALGLVDDNKAVLREMIRYLNVS